MKKALLLWMAGVAVFFSKVFLHVCKGFAKNLLIQLFSQVVSVEESPKYM
jgi:hypothetical protein